MFFRQDRLLDFRITMRDPLGLCIRRSSFSHTHSHVSRSEPLIPAECNEVGPSHVNDDPCQYPLPTADDGFWSIPNVSGLDFADNTSDDWLKDAGKDNLLRHLCHAADSALSIFEKARTVSALISTREVPQL